MATIYAVLAGINNYPGLADPLSGCINDIDAIEAWLKNTYPGTGKLSIKRLTDEGTGELVPTRENIIAAFNHFAQANGNDTCLFYFAGHGTNLNAPPEFTQLDSTQKLQALVCQDFYGSDPAQPVKGAITDKELAYLTWLTTKDKPDVNMVLITDCCHSGTMTRSATAVRGLMDSSFMSPRLKDFHGFDTGYYVMKGNSCVVEPGRHIHFAAAQDDQTAREVTLAGGVTRGAFSFALVKMLQEQAGLLSYRQLEELIAAKIQNYFYMADGTIQVPRLNLVGNIKPYVSDYIFLETKSIEQERAYVVYYSKEYGWCIKAGLLQNLSVGDEVTVDTGNGILKTFTVSHADPDFSVIATAPELGPLSAIFRGTLKKTCKVYFAENVPAEVRGRR